MRACQDGAFRGLSDHAMAYRVKATESASAFAYGGKRTIMGRYLFWFGIAVFAGLPGCLSFGGGDSDTRASRNAAETAIYREVAEMVKLYRTCLQKNEDTPV